MKKTIVAATLAGSIAFGGLGMLGGPTLAGAAETAGTATGWVDEALAGLVADGTIDQQQADAVETALREARPARGPGGRGFGGLTTVAEALDMTVEELRTALQEGSTIAEVAGEQDVAVDAVVGALVAAKKAHLDEKVAAGDLTQAEADERLADAEERATAMVNGERPAMGGGRHGRGGPRGGDAPATTAPDA